MPFPHFLIIPRNPATPRQGERRSVALQWAVVDGCFCLFRRLLIGDVAFIQKWCCYFANRVAPQFGEKVQGPFPPHCLPNLWLHPLCKKQHFLACVGPMESSFIWLFIHVFSGKPWHLRRCVSVFGWVGGCGGGCPYKWVQSGWLDDSCMSQPLFVVK